MQKTFYKPPQLRTARRWREEAPSGFLFSLKAWQLITHRPSSPTYRKTGIDIPEEARDRHGDFRSSDEVFEAWEQTRAIAEALTAPLVVFQCPASFEPTAEHKESMRASFGRVDRKGPPVAWERRGAWQAAEIGDLCEELDLIHCADPFASEPVTEGLAYFRLHGMDGKYHNYSEGELEQLKSWCEPFTTAYVLVNNVSTWHGARRFQEMLGQA